MVKIRVWDLPTRLFHWALVFAVIGLVATGKAGGSWMDWHMRLGYCVFALLVFRMAWGLVGGRWSRFKHFVPTPSQLWSYLRGQSMSPTVGHNPAGALSVLALLSLLLAQVATGLISDDEIAFTGPLTPLVSADTISWATGYHTDLGELLLLGLVALHLLAIAYHRVIKKHRLVNAMLSGDQEVSPPAPLASHDNLATRLLALVVMAVCAAGVYAVIGLASS